MDRRQTMKLLNRLSADQLQQVVTALNAPEHSGTEEAQVAALVEHADSFNGPGLQEVVDTVHDLFPSKRSEETSDSRDSTSTRGRDSETSDTSSNTVPFETTEQIEELHQSVEELLGKTDLEKLATELSFDGEPIAKDFADWLINKCKIDEVLPVMLRLADGMSGAEAKTMYDIVYRVLPVTYDRGLLKQLHTEFPKRALRLIPTPVGNATIAEVIMACHDAKPLKYDTDTMSGAAGFVCELAPESGMLEESDSNQTLLDFLGHLVANIDTTMVGRRLCFRHATKTIW